MSEPIANQKTKGYLVFTTHDQDEVDATFVPETETEILEKLRSHSGDWKINDDAIQSEFGKWVEAQPDTLRWHSQTRCREDWPFNHCEILGTFYHLVY